MPTINRQKPSADHPGSQLQLPSHVLLSRGRRVLRRAPSHLVRGEALHDGRRVGPAEEDHREAGVHLLLRADGVRDPAQDKKFWDKIFLYKKI